MTLTLTLTQRRHAEALIRSTSQHGANATLDILRHFPEGARPALIAYLARVACAARDLPDPGSSRYQHGAPVRYTVAQRKEARRLYGLGVRTPEVEAGKREYDRVWARQRRAQEASCPT